MFNIVDLIINHTYPVSPAFSRQIHVLTATQNSNPVNYFSDVSVIFDIILYATDIDV